MVNDAAVSARNLRLYLTFVDGLKEIEIVAATNKTEPLLRPVGVVKGKQDLVDMMEAAAIDHYIVREGDVLRSTYRKIAIPQSPKLIVDHLEKRFKKHEDLPLKILEGHHLTDEEKSFAPPVDLEVCAGTLTTEEGLKRLDAWFKSKNKARPAELSGS